MKYNLSFEISTGLVVILFDNTSVAKLPVPDNSGITILNAIAREFIKWVYSE